MEDTIVLSELLDLSLCTPEKGAVNFNHLYVLLAKIIELTNLENVAVNLSNERADKLQMLGVSSIVEVDKEFSKDPVDIQRETERDKTDIKKSVGLQSSDPETKDKGKLQQKGQDDNSPYVQEATRQEKAERLEISLQSRKSATDASQLEDKMVKLSQKLERLQQMEHDLLGKVENMEMMLNQYTGFPSNQESFIVSDKFSSRAVNEILNGNQILDNQEDKNDFKKLESNDFTEPMSTLSLLWRNVKVDARLKAVEKGFDKLFSMFTDVINKSRGGNGSKTSEEEGQNTGSVLLSKMLGFEEQYKDLPGLIESLQQKLKDIEREAISSQPVENLKTFETLAGDPDGTYNIIKSAVEKHEDQINEINSSVKDLSDLISKDTVNSIVGDCSSMKDDIERINKTLKAYSEDNLKEKIDSLEKLLDEYVRITDLEKFVSWPALEDTLNVREKFQMQQELKLTQAEGLGDIDETEFRSGDDFATQEEKESSLRQTVSINEKHADKSEKLSENNSLQINATVSVNSLDKDGKDDDNEEMPVVEAQPEKKKQIASPRVNDPDSKAEYPSHSMRDFLKRLSLLADSHDNLKAEVTELSEKQSAFGNVLGDIAERTMSDADADRSENEIDIRDVHELLVRTNQLAEENRLLIEAARSELSIISRVREEKPVETEPGISISAFDAIRANIFDLQEEQRRIASVLDDITGEVNQNMQDGFQKKQEQIDALFKCVNQLQEQKADKNNVSTPLDVESIRKSLSRKVDTSDFDTTFQLLDQGIQEALEMINSYSNEESILKGTLEKIADDLQGKLDTKAGEAIKRYLENRISDIQKSRENLVVKTNEELTNAAGMRKPLPVKFHCISCDRPVDLRARGVLPPVQHGLPMKKSKGPITTYEMDQIRSHRRNLLGFSRRRPGPLMYAFQKDVSDYDVMTSRACGGSHTVINPNGWRGGKGYSWNNIPTKETTTWKREKSVANLLLGKDGQVYRGRVRPVDMENSFLKPNQTTQKQGRVRPKSAEETSLSSPIKLRKKVRGGSSPTLKATTPRNLPPLETSKASSPKMDETLMNRIHELLTE